MSYSPCVSSCSTVLDIVLHLSICHSGKDALQTMDVLAKRAALAAMLAVTGVVPYVASEHCMHRDGRCHEPALIHCHAAMLLTHPELPWSSVV